MNTRKNLAYLMLCFFFAISCSKTDDPAAIKSSEKEITSFKISVQGQEVAAVISASDKKISALLPLGSDVKAIAPTIVISAKATVTPASGVAQDFSTPIKYIVKAEDGSTNEYTVTVTAAKSTEKKITSFKIPTVSPEAIATISEADKKISALLPVGSDLKAIAPTIVISDKATVTPASGVAQDFSTPIKYIVKAEDGSTNEYTVTVTAAKSTEKKITSFKIQTVSPEAIATISEADKKISLSLPFGSDVKVLSPVIVISDLATISPASGSVQNFTNPVKYTVTAQDGTTSEYTATVTALPSKCLITKVTTTPDRLAEMTFIYNSSDQMIQYIGVLTNGGSVTHTVTYDASGKMIKDEGGFYNGDGFAHFVKYSYNDKNQLILRETIRVLTGSIDSKTEYEYNSTGQLIKETPYSTSLPSGTLRKNYFTIYEYSNITDKNWIRSKLFDPESGMLGSTTEYEFDDKKIYLLGVINFGYGPRNNLTKAITKDASGVETSRILYTYEYNDIGYPTKMVKTETSSDSTSPTVSTQTYTYSCK